MAAYLHHGMAGENARVDTSGLTADERYLQWKNSDDGIQIRNTGPGNFEWWYFDILDIEKSILLKIVFHMGTDPLRRRFFPQLALSVKTENHYDVITRSYGLDDVFAAKETCGISVKNEFRVDADVAGDDTGMIRYRIKIDIPGFNGNFILTGLMEPWKPLGNGIPVTNRHKTGLFYWSVPVPRAEVSGSFTVNGVGNHILNAIGYHDHNAWIVDEKRKLFMDDIIRGWFWGKAYTDDYTFLFMDTHFARHSLRSFMTGHSGKIIHSSNNLSVLNYSDFREDPVLKKNLPFGVTVRIQSENTRSEIHLFESFVVERKDLLESVPAIPRWIIQEFVARPFYAGLLSRSRIILNNETLNGFGNYEMMVFRDIFQPQ